MHQGQAEGEGTEDRGARGDEGRQDAVALIRCATHCRILQRPLGRKIDPFVDGVLRVSVVLLGLAGPWLAVTR